MIVISLVSAVLLVGSATTPGAAGDAAAATVSAPIDAPAGSRSVAYRLEVGRPFPTIVLPAASDGSPLSLAGFRGRKTILHIFASW